MKTSPKAERDYSEVAPPQSVTVESEPRIILYKADGTPLKRQIGYK